MCDSRTLVKQFREHVIKQRHAIAEGDSRAAKKHGEKYIEAWNSLRKRGDEGREALASLLNDDNDDVRVSAAAFLLRYKTMEATRILKSISEGSGLSALGAEQALERWYEGEWNLDPDE